MPVLGTGSYSEKYIPTKMPSYITTTAKPRTTVVKPVAKQATVVRAASAPVTQAPVQTTPFVAQGVTQPSLTSYTTDYLTKANEDINKIYDQQKLSQLDQIKADQTASTNRLNQQKKDAGVSYQAQRNQADVLQAQNVQRLRELMAANGINASGENLTVQAQANSDRQNALTTIGAEEQSQLRDLDNQINDVNNPTKQNAIIAQIESERSKALLDAKNTAEERAWRQYSFDNMSASQKAQLEWAKQQYGEDAAWKMFELNYNGELQKSINQSELNFSGNGGGGGTASFQSHMSQAVQKGVPQEWVPLLSEIVKKESSYNPYADNPTSTAYGYGQFLDSTRRNYEKKTGLSYSDPVNQLIMMAQYVKDRYQTPQKALLFWNKNHWY
jgi:hypothetical protein